MITLKSKIKRRILSLITVASVFAFSASPVFAQENVSSAEESTSSEQEAVVITPEEISEKLELIKNIDPATVPETPWEVTSNDSSGEAIVTAKEKCPSLVIIPPDYNLYVKASSALIRKLKQYSDKVIQYSIDEAWAVFDGFESLYGRGQMVAFAYRLKDEIRTGLGFTVNIGISTNFLLAKTASVFRK